MELKDYITKRKSTRSYLPKEADSEIIYKIRAFTDTLIPLYPNIKVKAEIIKKENVKSLMSWLPPQLVAIYSEKKDGYLENIGFMFEQLDLYLHSLGLGSCWVGLGKPSDSRASQKNKDGLEFAILLAFGYPKENDFRNSPADFRRKALCEISNTSDIRLESARLAPSAVNSQPWYFVSEGDAIHAYRIKKSILAPKMMKNMNLIDMGISLAHIYVSNPLTFNFFKSDTPPPQKGCEYIGSFKI